MLMYKAEILNIKYSFSFQYPSVGTPANPALDSSAKSRGQALTPREPRATGWRLLLENHEPADSRPQLHEGGPRGDG